MGYFRNIDENQRNVLAVIQNLKIHHVTAGKQKEACGSYALAGYESFYLVLRK